MNRSGKFDSFTVWNENMLRYRILTYNRTFQSSNISEKLKRPQIFEGQIKGQKVKNVHVLSKHDHMKQKNQTMSLV